MDRNTCVIPIIKDICMSKCGRNVLKTRRYDSVLSPLFLFFNLIKTVAKFMRTESVKCPAHAVFAKSRARHVHIMSLNLLTSQGPISSTSLRRVFVLKTSYEVRTLKIGFHQTIELCELLTFCRIFKTNI